MEYFEQSSVLRLHECSRHVRQRIRMHGGHQTSSHESLNLSRTPWQVRARAGFPQSRECQLRNRTAFVYRMLRKRSLWCAVTRFNVKSLSIEANKLNTIKFKVFVWNFASLIFFNILCYILFFVNILYIISYEKYIKNIKKISIFIKYFNLSKLKLRFVKME